MRITLFVSAILLIIISIPLYMGKMSNMIAGYNTMSLKEKEKYNELKLCRVLAITLIITALVMILGSMRILSFQDTLLISLVILLIGCILSNIIPKK